MEFQYLETSVRNASIEIEDIGNCCIQAFTDEGEEYIFKTKTEMGFTTVIQFGPLIADTDIDEGGFFSYTRYNLEYNQGKLYKAIDKFLNAKPITQVFEIDEDTAYGRLNTIKF